MKIKVIRRGQKTVRELSKKEVETFAAIAGEIGGIETIETRNSDGLDFHEVAIWEMVQMLSEAYEAGKAAAVKAAKKAKKDPHQRAQEFKAAMHAAAADSYILQNIPLEVIAGAFDRIAKPAKKGGAK